MKALTEVQVRRMVANRGNQLPFLLESAASAAYDAVRRVRKGIRGEEMEHWESISAHRRKRHEDRALAVGKGEIRSVKDLYAAVLNLERHDDALEMAWGELLDWRLLELALELATLKLVMGSLLPESVGPVLKTARGTI